MDLSQYLKSIIDMDRASVVICNLNHEIIYMNPAAVLNYEKWGGEKLIGRSLMECHNQASREKIQQVVDWFIEDDNHNIVYTFHNEKQNKDVYMVALRDEGKLIGYYEKHEYRNTEKMKLYDLWQVKQMNIQIFGTKKCNDTKKAERFFKERGIKYQFIDMKEKGMSKGEFTSVAQANDGLDNMINWEGKDQDILALIKYIADEDKLGKVLENPQVIKTPVVRNGKQSTLGYQPDVWKRWN